ncbi:MAG: hypothetical protein GX295_08180 [Syntrophomonadaceae bacterium]|nr:hypothetical protein [Syntrophomonadaceae bacterium]
MYCEECNKRPATVHITQVINNKKTERHLCEHCAREYQQHLGFSFNFEPTFSIQHLLASLLNQEPNLLGLSASGAPGVKVEQQCPKCHMNYREFAQGGKFGCKECYEGFAERLEPLMRKIHGNALHNGKVPLRAGKMLHVKRQLEKLYGELQAAIRQEAFEKAAEIRDQIRELEKKRAE